MFPTPSVVKNRPVLSAAICFGLALASPLANACSSENMSFSASSNRLTIEGDVVCTLSDIQQHTLDWNVLTVLDADALDWQLNTLIRLEQGARLNLYGADNNGDVNTLRMTSGEAGFVSIIADWGQVDIRNTHITSWDTVAQAPDENLDDGRAFITVRSRLGDDGAPEESRLDVIDSEIGYLGYFAGESYGLTWKVADDNFEQVKVYGDMLNNYVHHNHRGHYSWGAFGSVLDNNEIAYSVDYGMDPHDDSDELIITNNYIHNSGNHGIICSRRCNDLVITGNTLDHNENGIMLHEEMTDSLVADNIISNSRNTGIAIYDSYNNIVRNNQLTDNHIGMRALIGSHSNLVEGNTVSNSERYGLFVLKGSAESQTTDGRSRNNVFQNNTFTNNAEGIFILESDQNQFINNHIEGFSEIFVKASTDNLIEGNTFDQTPIFKGRGEEGAPSHTMIAEVDGLVLDLDEFSSASIPGSTQQLKGFEDQNGLANHFTQEQLTLSLDEGKTFLSGPLVDLLFWVDAQGAVTVTDADLDKDNTKSWAAISADGGQSVAFEIGNLLASRQFTLRIDGTESEQLTSTSNGRLLVSHQLPANTQIQFDLTVLPEPVTSSGSSSGGTMLHLIWLLMGTGFLRQMYGRKQR